MKSIIDDKNESDFLDKSEIVCETVEDVISTIEKEFSMSNSIYYNCENGSYIVTDVGYVEEWFEKYKDKMREKYCN